MTMTERMRATQPMSTPISTIFHFDGGNRCGFSQPELEWISAKRLSNACHRQMDEFCSTKGVGWAPTGAYDKCMVGIYMGAFRIAISIESKAQMMAFAGHPERYQYLINSGLMGRAVHQKYWWTVIRRD